MKALICGLCQCVVHEDKLHTHLASAHGWFAKSVLPVCEGGAGSKSNKPLIVSPLFQNLEKPSKSPHAICSCCGVKVSHKKLSKHEVACKERQQIQRRMLAKTVNKVSVCPWCSAAVSEKKLKTHMSKRCPNRGSPSKILLGGGTLTKAPTSTYNDPIISAYLSKHPEPPRTGPQGVPQDKYRRSAYGRSGMEYDSWSRES